MYPSHGHREKTQATSNANGTTISQRLKAGSQDPVTAKLAITATPTTKRDNTPSILGHRCDLTVAIRAITSAGAKMTATKNSIALVPRS